MFLFEKEYYLHLNCVCLNKSCSGIKSAYNLNLKQLADWYSSPLKAKQSPQLFCHELLSQVTIHKRKFMCILHWWRKTPLGELVWSKNAGYNCKFSMSERHYDIFS